MNTQKNLSFTPNEPLLLEQFYSSYRGIFVHQLGEPDRVGMILDLDSLPMEPIDFKAAVIKWLINVNMTRLKIGAEPIVTLELALKCPVWKLIKPPLKNLKLTKEKLFNVPTIKTNKIGRASQIKGINKR